MPVACQTSLMTPSHIRISSVVAAACLAAVACVTTLPEGAPCTIHLAQLGDIGPDMDATEHDLDAAWPAYLAAISQLRAAMLSGGTSTAAATAALGAWADARDELQRVINRLVDLLDQTAGLAPAPETREAHIHVVLASRSYADLGAMLSEHVSTHQRLVQRSMAAEAPLTEEWRSLSIYVARDELQDAIARVRRHLRDMTDHLSRARRLCRESA